MKNKKSLLIIVVIIVAGLLLLNKLTHFQDRLANLISPQTTKAYYQDLAINNIRLNKDSTVYSLKQGKVFAGGHVLGDYDQKAKQVLRLALFYQWAKEDPLFISANNDSNALKTAVNRLAEAQAKTLKIGDLQNKFTPTDFLGDISDLPTLEKAFLDQPTQQNAEALLRQWQKTNRDYRQGASDLKQGISSLPSFWRTRYYVMLASQTFTSTDIISSDLSKIMDNSDALAKEISSRQNCLEKSLSSCLRPAEKFAKPSLSSNSSNVQPAFLSRQELNMSSDVKYNGPFIVNSPCWQKKDKQYLYVSKQKSDYTDYQVETSTLATDTYFDPTSSKYPYEKMLQDKGLQIYPQGATNTYTCTNLDYQSSLATQNYFYSNYKSKPLLVSKAAFGNNLPEEFSSLLDEASTAEKAFFDAQYPSQDQLSVLGGYYAYVYRYISLNPSVAVDNSLKDDLLTRSLMIREKMSDLDLILSQHTSRLLGFIDTEAYIKAKPTDMIVYPVKSAYSLCFLNFSSLVWRSDNHPEYLVTSISNGSDANNSPMGYILNYDSAVKKYGKDKVLNWLNIYNQLPPRSDFYKNQSGNKQ